MSDSQLPMWQRWAQFRFSVIGELLSCPPPKGELQQAIGRLAQKNYRHPIDSNRLVGFGPSTIERWYYKARSASDPIAVLGRKIRSDAGVRWSMPEVLLQALKEQYENYIWLGVGPSRSPKYQRLRSKTVPFFSLKSMFLRPKRTV